MRGEKHIFLGITKDKIVMGLLYKIRGTFVYFSVIKHAEERGKHEEKRAAMKYVRLGNQTSANTRNLVFVDASFKYAPLFPPLLLPDLFLFPSSLILLPLLVAAYDEHEPTPLILTHTTAFLIHDHSAVAAYTHPPTYAYTYAKHGLNVDTVHTARPWSPPWPRRPFALGRARQ